MGGGIQLKIRHIVINREKRKTESKFHLTFYEREQVEALGVGDHFDGI